MACCPAHVDKTPSLSIRYMKDRKCTSIHCFAGCDTKDVLDKAGLKFNDLYEEQKGKKIMNEIRYSYHDEKGNLVYTRIRKEYADGRKTFIPIQPDGTKNLKGVDRVIYNLPAVLNASTVYFVEGEKCADIINQTGYVATTLDCGSNSKWLPYFNEWLQDKEIIIIPDNDEAGLKYAKTILDNLPNAKVVKLPDVKEKGDIYDWVMSGHKMEEIAELPLFDLIGYFNSPNQNEKQSTGDSRKRKSSSSDETQSEMLIRLVEENGAYVFHDANNNCHVSLAIDNHREIRDITSENFLYWLSGLYYKHTKRTIRKESLKQVIEILSAIALFEHKDAIPLYERVAKKGGDFWYDLTNDEWQAIKITLEGWTVENNPPLLFSRYGHQNSQSYPSKNGDISRLLKYINISQRETLFLCWVVSCFVPDIPHAMPIFHGEKGAAKTTACELLKKLIDPSSLGAMKLSKSVKDLIIHFKEHWFVPYDNISEIKPEISDTLCRAITGGGIQVRKLYTNSESCIYTFQKCIALNGINNVAERADLLDRAILIELSRISEEDRKELSVVYREFDEDLHYILGGVFDVLSKAMKIYPTVKLNKLPRMADFARWCYAIAEAMGENGQVFIDEYTLNQEYQNKVLLESSTVATLIWRFMENRSEWYGSMTDLYNIFSSIAESIGINPKSKEFPEKPNVLGRKLNELKSNLELIGITFVRKNTGNANCISIENKKTSPLPPYVLNTRQNTVLSEYGNIPTDIVYEKEEKEEREESEEEVDF